jgi:hypothetical protein
MRFGGRAWDLLGRAFAVPEARTLVVASVWSVALMAVLHNPVVANLEQRLEEGRTRREVGKAGIAAAVDGDSLHMQVDKVSQVAFESSEEEGIVHRLAEVGIGIVNRDIEIAVGNEWG